MKRLARIHGRSLCLILLLLQFAVADLRAQAFVRTGSMTTKRIGHTATLLADGRVLIAGGAASSAEVYDPVFGSFAETGSLTFPRMNHGAALLQDGSVLLAGGCHSTGSCTNYTNTAELYNPSTGTFTLTGNLTVAQPVSSAVLLGNGKVLIVGSSRVELFDPATGTFMFLSPTNDWDVKAALLGNGTVLLTSFRGASIYDPSNNGFRNVSFSWPFDYATVTSLRDGSVLFAGGATPDSYGETGITKSATYDPATNTYEGRVDMFSPRAFHTATLLKDGRVLITGGYNGEGIDAITGMLASAEIYDPFKDERFPFSVLPNMTERRQGHTATLLRDGRVLITGGYGSQTPWLFESDTSAELFVPDAPPSSGFGNSAADARAQWPVAGVGDFNGDGTADVLWRHTNGTVAMGLINGPGIATYSTIANVWTGWSIAGVGDFNGDGTADILWRDTSGTVAMWLMNGPNVTSYSTIANVWTGWSISRVGDFNGDGTADILWRDTSGTVAMWLMNGPNVTSYSTIGNVWTGWSIAGVGDFNGDGTADILWRDTSGTVAMWLMNGPNVTSYSTIANVWTGWSIVGVGDFSGDRKADILWRETNGTVAMWLMNGTNITSYGAISNASPGWSISGVQDFKGDRKTAILWHDTANNIAVSLMDGLRRQ